MSDTTPSVGDEHANSIAPFLRNTMSMIAGAMARLGLQAVYFVVIARSLGADQFGAFSGVQALVLVISPFVSLGTGNLLIKSVARDRASFRQSWGNALFAATTLGMTLMVVVLLVSRFLLSTQIPILVVLFMGLADLPILNFVTLSSQAFQAFEKLGLTSRLNVVLIGTRAVAAVILIILSPHPSVMLWAASYLGGTVAAALYSLQLVHRELGLPILALGTLRRDVLEGLYFSVSLSSQSIYNNIDKTMLTRLSTLDATGIYATAYRLIDLAFQPVAALLASTYSKFFHHGAAGLPASTRFARQLLPFSTGYAVIAVAGLAITAPLVPHVFGSTYAGAVTAVWWLAPIVALRSVHYFFADALTGAGFQGVRTFVQVMIALQNVLLNLWLIPSHGWRGAAWASLASDGMLVIGLALSILFLTRKRGVATVVCGVEPDAVR